MSVLLAAGLPVCMTCCSAGQQFQDLHHKTHRLLVQGDLAGRFAQSMQLW